VTAYGFKDQFEPLIASGSKIGTVRRHRASGHAMPGNKIQLYVGLRTKAARKIKSDVTCFSSVKIRMNALLWRVRIGGVPITGAALQNFARAEGFDTAREFFQFFATQYPDEAEFEGTYILWDSPQYRYPYLWEVIKDVLPHSLPSKNELRRAQKTTSL